MERTKTPLNLVSIQFRGENFPVNRVGHSGPFSTEVKERVWLYVPLLPLRKITNVYFEP